MGYLANVVLVTSILYTELTTTNITRKYFLFHLAEELSTDMKIHTNQKIWINC